MKRCRKNKKKERKLGGSGGRRERNMKGWEGGKERRRQGGEEGGKKDVWMVTKKSFTKCSLEDLPQAELVAPISLAAYIISHL